MGDPSSLIRKEAGGIRYRLVDTSPSIRFTAWRWRDESTPVGERKRLGEAVPTANEGPGSECGVTLPIRDGSGKESKYAEG